MCHFSGKPAHVEIRTTFCHCGAIDDRRSKCREKERVGGMPAGGGKFTKKLLY